LTSESGERYLEDFEVGETFESAGITFTESGIIDFAMQFDPQAFHLDVEAANASIYEGLIASGFHTVSAVFRMFIQTGVLADCSMGSPGIDELKWLAPVRPGDTLRTTVEVLEVKPSRRGGRGVLRLRYSGTNQDDVVVTTFVVNHLVMARPE
jgi:acyl dehydratase